MGQMQIMGHFRGLMHSKEGATTFKISSWFG